MLSKERLRQADLFVSILIAAAGTAIVLAAASFPTGAELSGVRNDWYVSPALLPYAIGGVLTLMGIILFVVAFRETGAAGLKDALRSLGAALGGIRSPKTETIRVLAVVVCIVSEVYLLLPRADFVLSAAFFLVALMSMFAFEDDALLKKLLLLFCAFAAPLALYFFTGLGARLEQAFYYASDIPAAVLLAGFILAAGRTVGREHAKRYRKLVLIAFAVPLLLVPVFKYLLYIPFPHEGGVVALMDYVRFDLLDPVQE